MKKTLTFCDLCGKEQKYPAQPRWYESWGKIDLNFKSAVSIQQHYVYEDCCIECAHQIHVKVREAISKIEAENKSPLAEALK